MGLVVSAVNNQINLFKMSTFMELDYQFDLQRQLEIARAAGRQENLTQAVRTGGFTSMGAGAGSQWGQTGQFWTWVNSVMFNLSWGATVVFAVLAALSIFVPFMRQGWLQFLAGFFFFYFASFLFQNLQPFFKNQIYEGRAFSISLFLGLIGGAVLSGFGPDNNQGGDNKDNNQEKK